MRQNVKRQSFKVAHNPNYDRDQTRLDSMVHKFFDKKLKPGGICLQINLCQIKNLQINFINQSLKNLKEKSSFII